MTINNILLLSRKTLDYSLNKKFTIKESKKVTMIMEIKKNRTFKICSFKGENFFYPTPVISDLKYLIWIDSDFSDFFLKSWKEGFLDHPDNNPNYLDFLRIHSDNKTKITKIIYDKLYFTFLLGNKKESLSANQVLSSKIMAVLKKEKDSISELSRTFNNQLKCKTCQKLGVNRDIVVSWISLLLQFDPNNNLF